jgi:hypothetical protein
MGFIQSKILVPNEYFKPKVSYTPCDLLNRNRENMCRIDAKKIIDELNINTTAIQGLIDIMQFKIDAICIDNYSYNHYLDCLYYSKEINCTDHALMEKKVKLFNLEFMGHIRIEKSHSTSYSCLLTAIINLKN